MLNWPGAKRKPSAPSGGDSSRVNVSRVSRRVLKTRHTRGVIGPGTPAVVAASGADFINIQYLQPCGVQVFLDDGRKALQEMIVKIVVLLRFFAKALAIQRDRSCQFHSMRVKNPAVRRDQPGPAKDLAFADGLDLHRTPAGDKHLQCDQSLANQIKVVRLLALAEYEFPCIEPDIGRASYNEVQMMLVKALKKRMLGKNRSKCLHDEPPEVP